MLFNLMYITKVNKNNAGVKITFVISNLRLWKYTAGSKWYQFPISSNEETGQGANLDFLKYLKNSSFFYICQWCFYKIPKMTHLHKFQMHFHTLISTFKCKQRYSCTCIMYINYIIRGLLYINGTAVRQVERYLNMTKLTVYHMNYAFLFRKFTQKSNQPYSAVNSIT